ncbi:MAG: hypothetical protein EOO24_59395, partial [Comamonadaceae bacterium]
MLLPLAVLAIGLAATGAFVQRTSQDVRRVEEAGFARSAEAVKAEVVRRLQLAGNGLSALRGMHAAIGQLDAGQLQRYVARRDLEREFPGLRGFGVIERAAREDKERFEAKQAESIEGFTVRTSGSAPDMVAMPVST